MCNDSSKNSPSGGCNDYSLLIANTAITTISTANNNLDGTGSVAAVFTAGGKGSIIKTITIKAKGPVTQGMVRLYVGSGSASSISLYKEVPVQTTPMLANTPTPAPYLQTFEMTLTGDLNLLAGYKLYASTQNAEAFNIIVQGLDWSYPSVLPSVCCNFKQETANTGIGTATTANSNTDGSGNIATVFTASAGSSNGSMVKAITIKALQSTNEGMLRIFISPNGTTYSLMKEINIPQTVQSGFEPSYKLVLTDNYILPPNYTLGVSTQLTQKFAVTVEGTDWDYPI